VDHFGGFKDELLKMGIYKIRIKGKDLNVQQLNVERLSRDLSKHIEGNRNTNDNTK
jgi:hypothetical protein